MCGIVGIFDHRGQRPIDRDLLSSMNDSQVHRGPDDSGLFVEGGIGLGHRRLSIIDVSGGQQPLFNEDHSVVVVYNGEIFNYRELAKTLTAAGHTFRTVSDTEVIVHAWEEWGEACVERFRGQFAFALWDRNQQTLFLARDRLGIKPLHYAALPDGTFLFGSELKSLLGYPGLPREIDPFAVEDFFGYGYVPDPRTIYRDIAKLPPGHCLTLRRGAPLPKPKSFWEISFEPGLGSNEAAICEELVERLREAVEMRLISEVPLGAFLSGGVDSSAVVSLMAQTSSDPVRTCSISFGDPDYDESRYARQHAERYGTQHRQHQVGPDSFDLVDRLAQMYDEPFADSSAIPTYHVCAVARQNVTVALSGDGGDEVFAGYRRYRWHHYEEAVRGLVPDRLRTLVFGPMGALYPKLDWAPKPLRAKTTLEALARNSADAFFHSVSVVADRHRRKLLSDSLRRELQGYEAVEQVRRHMAEAPAEHHLAKVQYVDMKTYLPGDILTKVDRASMASSLEVRVPILDHKFVEWAAGIRSDFNLRGRQGKYIFKKALEPHVDNDILYRDKMGFAVPLTGWFRGPLRDRLRNSIMDGALAETGFFEMGYVRTLVNQHLSGTHEHSAILWSLVMFDSFLRHVHTKPSASAASGGGLASGRQAVALGPS
ncbi:MAG: amidotransferase 1, exosortase A system-associated [Kiloniellales bacterium]|nr:amidotransferase 1, exosortase A system-associated [Kiloniellales bacterium]